MREERIDIEGGRPRRSHHPESRSTAQHRSEPFDVVFSSLFGKKDKDGKDRPDDRRDARKAGTPGPARPAGPGATPAPGAPAARAPAAAPSTTPPRPMSPESKAAATAAATAKIDAIEKEMALEFTVSNTGAGKPKFEKTVDFRGGKPAPAPVAAPAEEEGFGLTDSMGDLNAPTDLLGGAVSANALEISASELAPAIEEVAVLYANGQPTAAIQVLTAAIQEDQLGPSTLMAWQMLFELYQQTGKRAEFDELGIQYAARFETSPPAFDEGGARPAKPAAKPTGSGTVFAFAGTLDGAIAGQLDKLRKAAEKQKVIRIDFNKVGTVQAEGAELLLGVLKGLRKSQHEVIFTGTEKLVDILKGTVEVGRRDPTDHLWMLLLEMVRVLGRQHEFEELSIDYCVTYEVSPPSWEPVKGMRAEAGAGSAAGEGPGEETGEGAVSTAASNGELVLSGEIEGKADAALNALAVYAAERGRIEVDCASLKRVDFAAAGNLLNALFGLAAKGKQVGFKRVNHLVAALFCVMGIQEVATIERRKL